ncbi:MAG: hypothetical protein PWR24_1195 [Desulfonauticus sp.]|jgi:uncharacterized Tic20 family protein|nr:hypothetical protein [Desulfonauticus sp.]
MSNVQKIRKKQLNFALKFGIPYFLFIIVMYLAVYIGKETIIKIKIFSLPLHYFLVAIFIYPLTWLVFGFYVKKANEMEDNLEKIEGEE